jgi:hypothetical protein
VTTTIAAAGRTLTLLAEKAAFLPASRTLLVADAHIGKAVSFRVLGVPVPRGTTSETLDALSTLVARWRARRVVFLGDFLHSARAHVRRRSARSRAGAHECRARIPVRGNHDSRAGDPPSYLACVSPTSRSRSTARASPSAPAARRVCPRRPPVSVREPGGRTFDAAPAVFGSATTSACCPRSRLHRHASDPRWRDRPGARSPTARWRRCRAAFASAGDRCAA